VFWLILILSSLGLANCSQKEIWWSTIPLIQHPLDQTGAWLSDSPLLFLLYTDCMTNQRRIPFLYLLHLLVHHHQGPLLCFLASTTTVDLQTLFSVYRTYPWNLPVLLKLPPPNFCSSLYFPKVLDYQDFCIIRWQVKRILLDINGQCCGSY